jgi:glycosyltransferase involved in cell wall biosynthesis
MRIAYFTNQYPAPSHTFIRREIAALEAKGHQVRRYAIRPFPETLADPADESEAEKTSHLLLAGKPALLASCLRMFLANPRGTFRALATTFRFARAAEHRYLRHLAYLMEAMVLADWCRRDHIEHLHAHFGTNPTTVAALAREIGGTAFSFTVHGPEEFDRPENLALRQKIRRASFVVGVSSFGRGQLMRWAEPGDWKKIHVVHCGIDHRYQMNTALDVTIERRLVCVARLSEQKGHVLLVQAAAMLQSEGLNFELILVGDGPLRPLIEAEIERLSLQKTIRLAGWMSQQDVHRELLRARAMVLPSLAEGLPVVLMESMALQRPVVSTLIAGIPELVRPDNGWLVPAGDVAALAEAMRMALTADAGTLKRMGLAARQQVLERHDVSRSASLLEGLMANSAKARSQLVALNEATVGGSA